MNKTEIEKLESECNAGNADSCHYLGLFCDAKIWFKKMDKNKSKALEYYKKSCKLGNKNGCFNAGLMYEKGEGVKKNNTKALEHYEKAKKLGHEFICEHYDKSPNI